MLVHRGSGLVMTNATTVEAHGICWIWGKALRNAITVSYTHLDVYKRQASRCSPG